MLEFLGNAFGAFITGLVGIVMLGIFLLFPIVWFGGMILLAIYQ